MRFLKYLLIAMLLIVGCGEEPKVFEQGGKTYYQDSSGDLYILVGTKKVKVEDYVEPPKKEEPKVEGTKSLTGTFDIAPYNLKVDLKLRYLDGMMWRAEIKDAGGVTVYVTPTPNQGIPLYKTKYFKRLQRKAEGTFLTLKLESSDGFTILDIPVISRDRRSNCSNVLTKEGKLNYYECQGKISSVSKETFSLIEKLVVGSRVLNK